LNKREIQVIKLLAEGKNNRETSIALGISIRTVEGIRANIMQKLSLGTFSDLVRYAVRNGIAQP
jgi:DNA-binding CsgD family transcriptional regulator